MLRPCWGFPPSSRGSSGPSLPRLPLAAASPRRKARASDESGGGPWALQPPEGAGCSLLHLWLQWGGPWEPALWSWRRLPAGLGAVGDLLWTSSPLVGSEQSWREWPGRESGRCLGPFASSVASECSQPPADTLLCLCLPCILTPDFFLRGASHL